MRSLWPQLAGWLDAPEPFALATVTAVSGSAPRAPGSCMAIQPETLRFIGSVSSGCLDAEVVDASRTAMQLGTVQHLRFGPDGNPPWSDGLTCGGWITVRVETWWGHQERSPVREVAAIVRSWLRDDRPGVVVSDDQHHLALDLEDAAIGDVARFPSAVVEAAKERLRQDLPPTEFVAGVPSLLSNVSSPRIFVRTIRRRPQLLIVGGVDLAVPLVAFGHQLGFRVVLVDPRAAFVASDRFPDLPEEIVRAWPQDHLATMKLGPRDAAVVVTHDPKIDDPALLALLQTHAGYIGALGSSRSHERRLQRLGERGADAASLTRIRGPAGIHLGIPDARGIALGIIAGIGRWQAERERAVY